MYSNSLRFYTESTVLDLVELRSTTSPKPKMASFPLVRIHCTARNTKTFVGGIAGWSHMYMYGGSDVYFMVERLPRWLVEEVLLLDTHLRYSACICTCTCTYLRVSECVVLVYCVYTMYTRSVLGGPVRKLRVDLLSQP